MHLRVLAALTMSILLAGCTTQSGAERKGADKSPIRIVPDARLHGRIATVNSRGQFVVVDFNVGRIPPLPTRMNVYRDNDIVGVINLTGPVNDNLVAADIVSGEPAVGDEAIWDREKFQPDVPAQP